MWRSPWQAIKRAAAGGFDAGMPGNDAGNTITGADQPHRTGRLDHVQARDAPTRERLGNQFYRQLSVGGLLILGAAESLYGLNTPFQSEQIGSTFAYRKVSELLGAN